MEMIRGLLEPDPVWQQQGRNHRRLQQPQLISMLARMLVGLPSLTASTDGIAETTALLREVSDAESRRVGVLETLICRIDSMSESESCEALQVQSHSPCPPCSLPWSCLHPASSSPCQALLRTRARVDAMMPVRGVGRISRNKQQL
jgi:hypothetical protein